MTKQRRHNRWKGHCAVCGRGLGNSQRKWTSNFKTFMMLGKATGRTRKMNRQRIVALAKDEAF